MNVVDAVRHFFAAKAPEIRRVVVAASGGVDSTALLLALHDARSVEFSAAHVNHHLRGAESDEDQDFVEALCRRLDVPLQVVHATIDAQEVKRAGVEAAARSARYDALRTTLTSNGADAIATAHHRDDQAETVMMRLISGGGPLRLQGVRERSSGIVRPLLAISRDELAEFVASRGITPRFDMMNRDRRFLRTRIREDLLPLVRSINPAVDAALAETARQAAELDRDLEKLTEQLAAGSIRRDEDETSFSVEPLLPFPFLLRRLMQREIQRLDENGRDVDAVDLRRIAGGDQGRESITRDLEILRSGSHWTLRRLRATEPEKPYAITISPGQTVQLPDRSSISLRRDESAAVAFQRQAKVQLFEVPSSPWRFEVRTRRSGDRFHPLGAPAEKSLKDFLIDRKISRDQRDNLPLLTCNDEIVWIAGVEVSEKFKVRGGTLRFRVELIDAQAGHH